MLKGRVLSYGSFYFLNKHAEAEWEQWFVGRESSGVSILLTGWDTASCLSLFSDWEFSCLWSSASVSWSIKGMATWQMKWKIGTPNGNFHTKKIAKRTVMKMPPIIRTAIESHEILLTTKNTADMNAKHIAKTAICRRAWVKLRVDDTKSHICEDRKSVV